MPAPLDIDAVALRFTRGVDIDDLPPWLPALTINRRIVLNRGLTRCEERWHGAHELGHIVLGHGDQRPLIGTNDPVLAADEAAADAFRLAIVAPRWELIEKLEAGDDIEELAVDYGLTIEHMKEAAEAAYADWRRVVA